MALTAKKVYAILKRQISDMEAKLNSPVRYRGTVATADLLPLNPDIGDMYNIESKSVYGEAGMNVAWNGVVWDTMGAPIDMSLYIKSSELADWVKQQNKPTYTAEEVGALPDTTVIPSKTSDLQNDSGFLTKIPDNYLSETDKTLSVSGKAADAKATGDKITELSADISNKLNKNQGSENSGKIAGINESGDIVPMFPVSVDYNEETNCLEFGSDQKMELNKGINLDSTLTKTGYAADAGAVGEITNSLKEDLDNLREIEFYPNLLNKAEFLYGKQLVVSAGSTPDDLADNENAVTTNIINCDGDEYFETNLPNGHTVILAYFWYQEKWYRSQFISSLEVEGDHFKFKINAQMKKIRIYCTFNMMPANPILTKQGEYDESKPEFFPKGKIKLTPSGCVGYDNLDEDTKQRINNKTSDYSEYIPFYGKKIVGIGDSIMVGIKSDGSAIIDGIGKNGLPCTDQGYQINSTGGFLGELRKKYPSINVVNMGVGSTTMQRNDNVNVNKVYKCIMDRIDSIPDDADIIILEGGINDFFHASKGCVLGTYKDNLYKYPTSAKYENGAYSYVEFAVDVTLNASTFCGALEIALTKILVRFVGKPFIYVIPHNPSASADIDTFFNSAKEICEKYGVPVVDIRKTGCMPRIYTLSGKTDGTSAFTQDGVHPNPLGYQLHYVPAIASTLKSIM